MMQLAPQLRQWFSNETLLQNLHAAFDIEFERLTDRSFAEGFHGHCRLEGTLPEDFFNVLDEAGLLGIRFKGLDLQKPFVDVVLTPQALCTVQEHLQVARQAASRYARFRPRWVRFFVPSHLDIGPLPAGMMWEKRFLAAPLQELKAKPLPARFDEVVLQVPPNLDFYEPYLQMYREIEAHRPEQLEFAGAESLEDLQDLLEAGTLFQVMHQGQWAGLVATSRAEEQGLKGHLVMEMLIARPFQGKGLGALAQRHLIEQVPHEPDDLLFGTIHADNLPSLRSALKNHRQDVGGYLWVTV